MRGRMSRVFGIFMMVALLLPSLVLTQTSAQDAGVLRVHQYTYPDVADPQKSSFANEMAVLNFNYEALTRLDKELNTVPGAAESWEYNEDATQITFKLREGLTYSDGSPLTAENFRYAAERTCDPNTAGQYQSILFDIVGCEEFATSLGDGGEEGATPVPGGYEEARDNLGVSAPDDLTLVIDLKHPAPYFHTVAGLWVFFPVKQELVEQGGDAWWQDPALQIGNGQYQIVEMVDDQLIAFEPNQNYWNGVGKIDRIEYVYQGDSAIALEAYRNGDLDIFEPDPSQLPEIDADPLLAEQRMVNPDAATYQVNFNLTQEPFTDIKVREAFSLAFDRETYCTVIRNGDCTPTLDWVPAGIMGNLGTDQGAFDPEAAKAALAESSYGGPEGLPEIKLYYNSDDSANTARAEWIAGQYREILGVELVLQPTEGQALVAMRKDPSTFPQMLFVGGWIQDYPDAQNWLSVYWKCDATFSQRMGYCNPELDAVLEQADQSSDQEERATLYAEAEQILLNDYPGPILYNTSNIMLVQDRVSGLELDEMATWPGLDVFLLDLELAD